MLRLYVLLFFFFQAEDGIRDLTVTGVQTCALPISQRRGNSVYLPDRVVPMLPERLSNGVCSLNPHVDRLTHSVFLQFDRKGRIDRKSTRLNSSHSQISYAVFCLKKKSILCNNCIGC